MIRIISCAAILGILAHKFITTRKPLFPQPYVHSHTQKRDKRQQPESTTSIPGVTGGQECAYLAFPVSIVEKVRGIGI